MYITPEIIQNAHRIVLDRAIQYNPIYYGDLYHELGLDHEKPENRTIACEILTRVNEIEGKDCMITAFVVSRNGNGPFEGFYFLAEQWGMIESGLSEEEREEFWIAEMKKVRDKYR